MNNQVIWLDSALDQLAQVYVPVFGTERAKAITRAMAEVDRRLFGDAANEGESRTGHVRILFESPLTIYFEVHMDQQAVIVVDIGCQWR